MKYYDYLDHFYCADNHATSRDFQEAVSAEKFRLEKIKKTPITIEEALASVIRHRTREIIEVEAN